jgi:hypothetical protein
MQKIVFLTDLHEGHTKIDTAQHYETFRTLVYPQLTDCSILFIGGDWYDTLLDFNSHVGHMSCIIINDLLSLSQQHGFYIRVLQGTFSHDRDQLKHWLSNLEHANAMLRGKKRVDVIQNITLEAFEELQLRVGYIPDDLPNESNWDVLRRQMEDVHWPQIDILLHHGYFKHLLGSMPAHIIPKNTLDYNLIKTHIKGIVLNGHIHTPSIFERVLSGGSLERFCHGEEEDKGFFIIRREPETNHYDFEFIVNPKATLFRTLNLSKVDDEKEAMECYIAWLAELEALVPPNTRFHVRVIIHNPMIRVALERYTKEHSRFIVFTSVDTAMKHTVMDEPVVVLEDLTPITEANLVDMLVQHITCVQKKSITPEEVAEVLHGGPSS